MYPRSLYHLARHAGRGVDTPTWREASLGAKVAALAVLALLGAFVIPAAIVAGSMLGEAV